LLTYGFFECLIEDLREMKERDELNQMAFFFLAGAMHFQIRTCVVEPTEPDEGMSG